LAHGGNWHTATNSYELQQETYSRYWFPRLLALTYQLLAVGTPNILAQAAETGFMRCKEQVP
jgi:hypothetical protein